MRPVSITIAGRGNKILRVGGRIADHVLLWAIPDSDLDRIVGVVRSGGDAPLTWAPLVDVGPEGRERARVIAAYGVLNASKALRASWGVDDEHFAAVRAALVQGGASNAVVARARPRARRHPRPGPRPEGAGARGPSRSARPTWPSPRSRSTPYPTASPGRERSSPRPDLLPRCPLVFLARGCPRDTLPPRDPECRTPRVHHGCMKDTDVDARVASLAEYPARPRDRAPNRRARHVEDPAA